MAVFKLLMLFSIICAASAVDFAKFFKGCSENIAKMKMGEVQQCVMGELHELAEMMPKSQSGGGGNPSELLLKLQNPSFQELILPPVAETICGKRLQIVNCTKKIVALNCLDDLHYIGIKIALRIFIEPVFKYTCAEVATKENLPEMIKCGLNLYPDIQQCLPKVEGKFDLDKLCLVMDPTLHCVQKQLYSKCSNKATKLVMGYAKIVKNGIGCVPPAPVSDLASENQVEKKIHVNVNRYSKSATNRNIFNFTLLIIPAIILALFK